MNVDNVAEMRTFIFLQDVFHLRRYQYIVNFLTLMVRAFPVSSKFNVCSSIDGVRFLQLRGLLLG